MTEPSPALVEAAGRLPGRVLILGGSGKMGPELAATLRRADQAAGVERDVVVASTFSSDATRSDATRSDATRRRLTGLGVSCLRADLTDPDQIRRLPHAPLVIYMLGFKFGSDADHRRAFHVNGIVPYLIGRRYARSRIVVFSSTNPYAMVPCGSDGVGDVGGAIAGSREEDPPAPSGVYGWSVIARESAFATTALADPQQRVCILRLAYAQHLCYGVLRDLADMVARGDPISLAVPAVNLISQRDAIDYALRSLERCANPGWTINVAGPACRVTDLIAGLGRRLEREPRPAGEPGERAPIADDRRCRRALGEPRDGVEAMVDAVAAWVRRGGESWGKPTRFGNVERSY